MLGLQTAKESFLGFDFLQNLDFLTRIYSVC